MLSSLLHEFQGDKRSAVIHRFRNEFPWMDNVSDDEVYRVYTSSVTMFQSRQRTNGNSMEDILSKYLSDNGISHYRQIPVSQSGHITSRHDSISLIDFIIADTIRVNDHISNYTIISTKTSCRERWLQDTWTFTNKPKKYILFTLSNDYPDPVSKFGESHSRVIITMRPKKKDTRIYKLTPDHLLSELL